MAHEFCRDSRSLGRSPTGELQPGQTGLVKGRQWGDTAVTGILLSGDQARSLLAAHGHCFQSAVWQMAKTSFLGLGISFETHRNRFGSGSVKSPCSLKRPKISCVGPGSGFHVSLAQRQLFAAALFTDCTPSSSPGSRAGCSRTWAHTASSDSWNGRKLGPFTQSLPSRALLGTAAGPITNTPWLTGAAFLPGAQPTN